MRTPLLLVLLAVMMEASACRGESNPRGTPGTPLPPATPVNFPLTINGTVVFPDGSPRAGVAVSIPGHLPTTTDSNGHFVVPLVLPPYDVFVHDSAQPHATVTIGLHRPDPFIVSLPPNPTRTGHANVTVSGAWVPPPSGDAELCGFRGPATEEAGGAQPSGNFDITASWSGAATLSGTAMALTYSRDNFGKAIAFLAYGKAPCAVSVPAASCSLVMQSAGTATLTGHTPNPPAGYSLASFVYAPDDAGTFGVGLGGVDLSTPDFALAMPVASNLSMDLFFTAESSSVGGLATASTELLRAAPDATNVTFLMYPAATLSAPYPGATNVTTATALSWSQDVVAVPFVHIVTIRTGNASLPSYTIITDRSTTALPSMASAGLSLSAGQTYSWQVESVGSFASIDEFAGNRGLGVASGPMYDDMSLESTFETHP